MKNPLVSVVIPSYNRLEYLLKAIQSVLDQEYENIEIIVVNDGSTQEGYLEHKFIKHITQINLKENQKQIYGFGPGSIRNFGIEKAKGSWVAFLDDDDIWFKEKLKEQIEILSKCDSLICSTDALIGEGFYKEDVKYLTFLNDHYYKDIKKYLYRNYFLSRFKKLQFPKSFNKEYITTFNPIITSSVIVKKDILDKLGGFRNLPYSADYDLWKAVLQFSDCEFINKPLIYYDNSHGYGREYKK